MTEVDPALLPVPSEERYRTTYVDVDAALDLLILSKDRACQLDALLRSIRAFLTIPHRIHILYTSSNLTFERGYDLVRRWHPGIHWVDEEGTFRLTYLRLLEYIASGPGRYLMPVMDDMIFIRPFTAHRLLGLLDEDEDVLAVSLRLGENVTYCYVRNIDTTPPDFSNGYRWAWKTASSGYWNYPMSVDANIYRTAEMAQYLPTIPFEKAETVEASMAGHPIDRPHLVCEATPTVLNLALNQVQYTFENRHGRITPEALNGAFLSGFAMDLLPFIGRTFNSCHVEVEPSLVPDRRLAPPATAATSSPSWRPRRSDRASKQEDGDAVSLKLTGGNEALTLNPTAAVIWNLCDGTRTVDEMQAELAARFQADGNLIRRDLRTTLESFAARGLLAHERRAGEYRRVDLREIPCFVINCKDEVAKRAFMERQLADLSIRFEIVPGVRADPNWIGVSLSHLKVLRLTRAEVPFLVLEDDCLLNDRFRHVWDVPVEADALYLGVSEFGLQTPGEFSWGRQRKVRWEHYDPSYLRVFNLLARHAVVYLSADYCERVIQSQIVALTNHSLPYPGDIGCAMLHASHVILTPNDPVCRQTDRDSTVRSLREL